ncbi:MAG: FAD-dependent monooxygenase [Candidatus Obscuribacterales bacterium]|nr:FAD-dependent monooxygenase [Candidatus Obscuribacterales bacterium]
MGVKKQELNIALVGAGLVGSLLSIFLARRGIKVKMFERRPDMRKEIISAGRSINLAISTRGIKALSLLGLDKSVLAKAVPMRGRMMHSLTGELTFQSYGMNDDECINSISRGTLNKLLMTEAEKSGLVEIEFNKEVTDIEFESDTLTILDKRSGQTEKVRFDMVIGTDGSASAIRHAMLRLPGYQASETKLEYGYKELVILPDAAGGHKLEPNALHIWPRGNFMLIALPNFEGSFTCTLFLPFAGPLSFEHLQSDQEISAFFQSYFADAVPYIDNLVETFKSNPTGHMVTVKSYPWNIEGKTLLLGDAAHGIVPFFGQGMNCGFEDCSVLSRFIDGMEDLSESSWAKMFAAYGKERKVNADAIADMAVENFVEMRDKVADPKFLLEKEVEKILQKEFPGRYVSRYALVTFNNVPYKLALDAGIVENEILSKLCKGINKADEVDLSLAERLIDESLVPLLEPYTPELSLVSH